VIPYERRQFIQHLFTVRGSVLPAIIPRLVLLTGLSVVSAWLYHLGHLPVVPLGLHALVGGTLGLLLAFRTNSAYERFWEGRKAWGSVVNHSRNLVRKLVASPLDEKCKHDCVVDVVAFVQSLERCLRGTSPEVELARLYPAGVPPGLLTSPGTPQRCLLQLSQRFAKSRTEGRIDSIDFTRLDADVSALLDQLGVCERIQRTPIPLAYVLHLRRALLLFAITLPFALVKDLGVWAPLAVFGVLYVMLGIEQIGVEIEDPFEISPNNFDLEAIAGNIEREAFALLCSRAEKQK
jgi:ion channel-forming bestrophin family protein